MKKLLFLFFVIIGCTDNKEYSMDVELLKSMVADHSNKNDLLLKKMDKIVHDNGMIPSEASVLAKATDLISKRNTGLKSSTALLLWSNEIEQKHKLIYHDEYSNSSLSDFYSENLGKEVDSLTYYKLILSNLELEEDLIKNLFGEISAPFFFNGDPHILKTSDTININGTFEFTVIPDYYDYKRCQADSCSLQVYKDDNKIEIPTNILQAGNAFIISIQPKEAGNYKAIGSFILKDRNSNLKLDNKFLVEFVVQKL
ncbi:MAG: hypothetical protein U0U66_14120 [Cytophagaceae bacterium]